MFSAKKPATALRTRGSVSKTKRPTLSMSSGSSSPVFLIVSKSSIVATLTLISVSCIDISTNRARNLSVKVLNLATLSLFLNNLESCLVTSSLVVATVSHKTFDASEVSTTFLTMRKDIFPEQSQAGVLEARTCSGSENVLTQPKYRRYMPSKK